MNEDVELREEIAEASQLASQIVDLCNNRKLGVIGMALGEVIAAVCTDHDELDDFLDMLCEIVDLRVEGDMG